MSDCVETQGKRLRKNEVDHECIGGEAEHYWCPTLMQLDRDLSAKYILYDNKLLDNRENSRSC